MEQAQFPIKPATSFARSGAGSFVNQGVALTENKQREVELHVMEHSAQRLPVEILNYPVEKSSRCEQLAAYSFGSEWKTREI